MKRALEVLMDVADNLEALSGSLRNAAEFIKSEYAEDAEDAKPEVKKSAEAAQPKISLEQVRAVLADKSQAGFTAEVRDLIAKYGSSKLSGIDPEHYPALLKEAEEIGNA